MMNRAEFMRQLKVLLSDIPETERIEALEYYENYFEDAGPEREAEVIRELGSPGKVAAIIRADLGFDPGNQGEDRNQESPLERKERSERGYHVEKKKWNPAVVILMVLGLIMIFPVLLGVGGGIFGILVAALILPFAVLLAAGACALGFFAGAVACVVAGIGVCPVHIGAGLLSIGVGCLLGGAGILILLFLVWAVGTALPWLIRKGADFFQNLIYRNRRKGGESL